MKALKNKCPMHNTCCVWDTKSLKAYHKTHLQQVKISKKKFVAKTLELIHPSNNKFTFSYQIASFGTQTLAKILTIVPYSTNYSFTNSSKFTYTLANVIISRPVVIYEL